MNKLYPLSFKPICKEKIWGGQKIKNLLHKDTQDLKNCGESWEISGVEGSISVVESGKLKGIDLNALIEQYKSELVGEKVYEANGNQFPLLIKFLDANEDLSIQVHPNDALALQRHQCLGKTEMWYVVHADQNATLITGFNAPTTKEIYLQKIKNNTLNQILNTENAQEGDVFFVPAGRIHTIGKGLLIAEIQQTSDITYRIDDFQRTDDAGNHRELHIDQSINALDYTHYPNTYKTQYNAPKNDAVNLVAAQYFKTNLIQTDTQLKRDYTDLDSFVILIVIEGNLQIHWDNAQTTSLQKGQTLLIPACIKHIEIVAEAGNEIKILETFVP